MNWHQMYLFTDILWLISIFFYFCDSPFLDIFFDFFFFFRVKFVNPTNAPRASVRCVHVLGKCVDHIITLFQIHLRKGPISLLLSHLLFIKNLTSNLFCARCFFFACYCKNWTSDFATVIKPIRYFTVIYEGIFVSHNCKLKMQTLVYTCLFVYLEQPWLRNRLWKSYYNLNVAL